MKLAHTELTHAKRVFGHVEKGAGHLASLGKKSIRNLQTLDGTEGEEQEKNTNGVHRSGGIARVAIRGADPVKYMSSSEKKKWEKLSDKKKRRYINYSRQKEEQRKGGARGPESRDTARNGPRIAKEPGQKQGGLSSINRTTEGGVKIAKSGEKAARGGAKAGKAAVETGTSAAAGAATAGASIAAEKTAKAAKKAATKFKNDLQAAAVAEEESLKKTIAEEERKKDVGSQPDSKYSKMVAFVTAVVASVATAFASVMMSIFAILLPLIIIICLVSSIVTAFISIFSWSAGGRDTIVEAALSEYDQAASNIGGEKYRKWYGIDGNWCGMFVAYCADQCGYLENGIIPNTASVAEAMNWYISRGQFENNSAVYFPEPGDIAFFTNGMSHMGIVVSYDETTDCIEVVEGNSGYSNTDPYWAGTQIRKKTYERTSAAITGYGVPVYPDVVDKLHGGSNAEKIFNALIDQGYTKEAASAVIGNLYQEAGSDGSGDILLDSTEGNGEGIGMCQWSFGRKAAFMGYALTQGQPWPNTSLQVQVNFMLFEMSGPQWLWTKNGKEYGDKCNISIAEFRSLSDVDLATEVFCAKYERCHKKDANLSYRKQMAWMAYNQFGGS